MAQLAGGKMSLGGAEEGHKTVVGCQPVQVKRQHN